MRWFRVPMIDIVLRMEECENERRGGTRLAQAISLSPTHPFSYPLLLLLLLAGLATLPAQAQQIRAYVSTDSITVGDRFFLSLVAEHGLSVDPIFPPPAVEDSLFGDIEVLSIQDYVQLQKSGSGLRIDSMVYEVTTFAIDTAFVPSLPVVFTAAEDTFWVASSPFILPVTSLVPEGAEGIQDLAPLAEFPRSVWPWIAGGLVALVALALFYLYMKKRREQPRAQVISTPPRQISPLDEALERLGALESVNLHHPAAVKPFYVELSELTRAYLGRKLDVHALESTTREVLHDLTQRVKGSTLAQTEISRLGSVFDLADFAKFADFQPSADKGKWALTETRTFLNAVESAYQAPAVPESPLEPESNSDTTAEPSTAETTETEPAAPPSYAPPTPPAA